MGWNGIERNKLDFILSDLLPVEISELFSFRSFYDFLLRKENNAVLTGLIEELKKEQAKSNTVLFKDKWATSPLKFNILKGVNSLREMSLIQPLSALNIYLFIECYQKRILDLFEKNHCFSIRYHRKSNDLYYKTRSKKAFEYFRAESIRIGKGVLQQTGGYFKIAPFDSVRSFTASRIWRICNFKYRYFAKIDYKSCFDSVYSHAYKWIAEGKVIDSKEARNSSIYLTIDRLIQNINCHSSNGVVVGPEFSRMIVEVLLQQIDSEVMVELLKCGFQTNRDYRVFRYVDDIFIFSNTPEIREKIIALFQSISGKYLLRLNELKFSECETPATFSNWIEKTRILADKISGCFFSGTKQEYRDLEEDKRYMVKSDFVSVDRMKDEFVILMKEFPQDRRTIVSFLLSTLLNKFSLKKDGYQLFKEGTTKKASLFADLSMFMYSYSPCFEHTRKIISILVFMNTEVGFSVRGSRENEKLQQVIDRHSFLFERGNLADLCDWFIFFREYGLTLSKNIENAVCQKAQGERNPLVLANILLYSEYYEPFFNETVANVEEIISSELEKIVDKKYFEQPEFWFVLVFHNCAFLSQTIKSKATAIITSIKSDATGDSPSAKATRLVCDYLLRTDGAGNKFKESFFNWHNRNNSVSQIMTFRTYQRTLFKNYRGNKYGLYASID